MSREKSGESLELFLRAQINARALKKTVFRLENLYCSYFWRRYGWKWFSNEDLKWDRSAINRPLSHQNEQQDALLEITKASLLWVPPKSFIFWLHQNHRQLQIYRQTAKQLETKASIICDPCKQQTLLYKFSFCPRKIKNPKLYWHPAILNWDRFRLSSPSLVGAYYLHPPEARAIFLYTDLRCNDMCSVIGGSITYWGGGHKRKRSSIDQKILKRSSIDHQTNSFYA